MPFSSFQRYLVALVPIAVFALVAYYFSDIVTYIILAWVLSMIGAPVNGMFKKYLGRNIAAALTLLSFTLLLSVLLWLFIPPILTQARNFANIDYNQLIVSLEEPVNDWRKWLVDKGLMTEAPTSAPSDSVRQLNIKQNHLAVVEVDSILKSRGDSTSTGITLIFNIHDHSTSSTEPPGKEVQVGNSFFDQVKLNLLNFFDPAKIPQLFTSIVGFFGNLLIAILSIFFISFFFIREQGLFSQIVKALVPNEHEDHSVRAIEESSDLLIRYFVGVAFQITIITIFISGVLTLLDFKNALLIGFFAAIMNVIPYIGPILGAAFAVIIAVSSNMGAPFYSELLPKIVKLTAVFAAMQLMDNFILQPNIFSKSVKAHPLEIFIVVLVGAKLGGILGMVVAIPIYTILRVIGKVFLSEFKIVQRITSNL